MLVVITFKGEMIPFIEECTLDRALKIIEKAKEQFELDKQDVIVEEERVVIHMREKTNLKTSNKKRKRLYCYNDSIILQTDANYKEETETTRELLAFERNIKPKEICIVEI